MPEPAQGCVTTAADLEAYLHDRIPLTRACAPRGSTSGW